MNSSAIDNITHLSRKYAPKIKKLTEPLKQQFGISYFALQHVSHDGKWNLLGNNPTWLEFSAGNKFYQHDPSLANPSHYQNGITLPQTHLHEEFQNTLVKIAINEFDIDNPLAVIEKNDRGCEFIFFAAPKANHKIVNTYISQIKLLQQYIKYFKSECEDIINQFDDYHLDLKTFNPEIYFGSDNILDISPALEINDLPDMSFLGISKREQQCLYHFMRGKTAKETALLLHLSFRTVEQYISNLKDKLGCRYKRDLLKLLFPLFD